MKTYKLFVVINRYGCKDVLRTAQPKWTPDNWTGPKAEKFGVISWFEVCSGSKRVTAEVKSFLKKIFNVNKEL